MKKPQPSPNHPPSVPQASLKIWEMVENLLMDVLVSFDKISYVDVKGLYSNIYPCKLHLSKRTG